VVANFAFAGTFEVALPALAHARFGAGGYGALIACLGAGSVAGTLAATLGSSISRPAIAACLSFLVEGAAIALVPFLGGLPGAAVAVTVLGICNGFGNIILITLLQQWAPGYLLGRVMSLVMLAAMGTYPGAILALAVLGALTQRVIRSFGAVQTSTGALETEPR